VGNILVKDPVTGGMTHPGSYLNTVWAGAGVPNTTEQFFLDGLSSFSVRERTTAVYLMGDIGGPSNNFHMNFGVRVVDTDLTIDNGTAAQVPTFYGTAVWNGVDSNVIPTRSSAATPMFCRPSTLCWMSPSRRRCGSAPPASWRAGSVPPGAGKFLQLYPRDQQSDQCHHRSERWLCL